MIMTDLPQVDVEKMKALVPSTFTVSASVHAPATISRAPTDRLEPAKSGLYVGIFVMGTHILNCTHFKTFDWE